MGGYLKKQISLNLFLVTLLLGAPVVLLHSQRAAASQYPGTNGRIVYASSRDGNADIYIMNPDGTFQQNLTNSPSANDSEPAVSPDGTKIAYVSEPVAFQSSIWVMNADGSNQQQLTTPTASAFAPDWSPDGSKIIYSSGPVNQESIHVMNADGTNQTPIISSAGINDAYGPTAWSPDGTKIVYLHLDPTIHYNIHIADADGSNPQQLTNNAPNQYSTFPSWSPDGTKILFYREVSTTIYSIYSMDTDGSNQTQLTTTGLSYSPTWSPDGTKIAYFHQTASGQPTSIWTMNANGTGQMPITTGTADISDSDPYWSVISLVPSASPGGDPGPGTTTAANSQGDGLANTGQNIPVYILSATGLIIAAIIVFYRQSQRGH